MKYLYRSEGNRSDSMKERVTSEQGSVDILERRGAIRDARSIGRSTASYQGCFNII